ncbi:MAG: transposase, partial [Chloroflexota bacterium]
VTANHGARTGRGMASPLRRRSFVAPASGELGNIVGTFKSMSARRINKTLDTQGAPVWQRNYYERVIRDSTELDRIRAYIMNNPAKWAEDKHNPVNL